MSVARICVQVNCDGICGQYSGSSSAAKEPPIIWITRLSAGDGYVCSMNVRNIIHMFHRKHLRGLMHSNMSTRLVFGSKIAHCIPTDHLRPSSQTLVASPMIGIAYKSTDEGKPRLSGSNSRDAIIKKASYISDRCGPILFCRCGSQLIIFLF